MNDKRFHEWSFICLFHALSIFFINHCQKISYANSVGDSIEACELSIVLKALSTEFFYSLSYYTFSQTSGLGYSDEEVACRGLTE